LTKVFRTPPKSDGKSFSTFRLFELIRKLEGKEIRTWTQLAIQLGVEPPSTEKNQSAQKVQQYAVRLKRWMRAMHVDAFFEYCLSKPHPYYEQVPHQHESFSEEGRDGVLMEEDLALRALLPEWRPKRGRRKAEERDNDCQTTASAAKRPHLETPISMTDFDDFEGHHSTLFPQSAVPWSAHPNDPSPHDQWAPFSAIAPSTLSNVHANTPHPTTAYPGGQHFRWRLNARETTPSTPYPQSAVTPRNIHSLGAPFDEPQSAITPSSSGSRARPRRRHGPAVSSAWSTGGNAATGKLRGRPPSNRSVRDGPFSTFPANPNTKERPTINLGGSAPASTPVAGKGESPRFEHHSPRQSPRSVHQHLPIQARPSRLQLQVPQHSGGPVRLATPPTVVVNGGYSSPAAFALNRPERQSSPDFFEHVGDDEDLSENASWQPEGQLHEANIEPGLNLKDIAKAFSASLKNAEVDGGDPLTTDDAKRLAEKVIDQLRHKQGVTQQPSPDKIIEHYALILGLNKTTGLGVWPPSTEKQVSLKRAKSDRNEHGWAQGAYEESEPGSQSADEERQHHDRKEVYEIRWKVIYGDLVGSFHFKDLRPDEPSWAPRPVVEGPIYTDGPLHDRRRSHGTDDVPDVNSSNIDWKKRYLDLQRKLKEKEEDLQGLRRRVLEAVF
ncbi:MAG: hypothetical protein M1830_003330, partial [Pleopsidium flavum]